MVVTELLLINIEYPDKDYLLLYKEARESQEKISKHLGETTQLINNAIFSKKWSQLKLMFST